MKTADFKRRPPGLSGSTWRKIFEITNHCGQYAPRLIARRRQLSASRRRELAERLGYER
jgi:hypothetical protein